MLTSITSNVPLQQKAGFKLPRATLLPTVVMTWDRESLDKRPPSPGGET